MLAKVIMKKLRTTDYYAIFILVSGLILLLYISTFERSRSHYYLVAYPFIAIAFGYFCAQIFEFLENKVKYVVLLFLLILFVFPLYYSAKEAFVFSREDTRVMLNSWLKANSHPTDVIVYNSDSIKPVIDLYGSRRLEGFANINLTEKQYIIVASDNNLNQSIFSLLKYGSQLKKQFTVDSYYRNGPNIVVYSTGK
jgi:hypothetical protein